MSTYTQVYNVGDKILVERTFRDRSTVCRIVTRISRSPIGKVCYWFDKEDGTEDCAIYTTITGLASE